MRDKIQMRLFLWRISAICLLMMAQNMVAGESKLRTITLLCRLDEFGSPLQLAEDVYKIELNIYCPTEFLNQLRANLEKHNLKLDTTTNTREPTALVAILGEDLHEIYGDNADDLYIGLDIYDIGSLAPSTILAKNIRHPARAWIGIANWGDQYIATVATGIILYNLDDCETAMNYFAAARLMLNQSTEDERTKIYGLSFYQGNCSILLGDYEKAVDYFESGLYFNESRNDKVELPTNLAWTYLQLGDQEKTFDLMARLVEENLPPYPSMAHLYDKFEVASRKNRAQLYALVERYDDAISDLNAAIDLPPLNTPDLYTLRGQMYLALYEWDSALADYNRVIELDPDYADAYYERGVLYYSILQTGVELRTDALADFQKYLELAPEGEKAVDAARYIEQIETELEALNG
jgi:tetratricopeptide (TPR) repeat protein